MPYVTSFGMFPVSAMLLYNLPICSCILSGAYFVGSNGISSQPRLFFWLHFGYCFSDLISCERYRHSYRWYDGSWLFIFIEHLFKMFRNNLICSAVLAVRPFFPFIKRFCGGLRCLIFFTASYILVLSFCMFYNSAVVCLIFSFSSFLIMKWVSVKILFR